MRTSDVRTQSATPERAAKVAGLIYVSDNVPGISRQRAGKSFAYRTAKGSKLSDPKQMARIRQLAIPPAWQEVWICPQKDGHLQATGRDEKGRKQYRYHPSWNEVRNEAKYERVIAFGTALPKIRRRVTRDLKRPGMVREKVMATLVRLLESTLIRVGNDEYADQNGSYGLTTLHNRHATVRGREITFQFKGKSGKHHEITVQDPRLAKLVRKCQELPGQDLFGYIDDQGVVRDVTSDDVNAYLRDVAGGDFSAKDFRTWAGTILAAVALREFESFNSEREAKRNVVTAIESVAKMLGNTPTVCRRCYVHPAILDGYLSGQTIATLKQAADEKILGSLARLKPEEAAVMMLLRERLSQTRSTGKRQRASTLTRGSNAVLKVSRSRKVSK